MSQREWWTLERQPDPPYFGQAKRVSRLRLGWEVSKRRRRCREILAEPGPYCSFEPGLVTLAVLSCRRLEPLRGLCETLRTYLDSVETYPRIETVLVDNASEPELLEYARGTGLFDEIIAHPVNLGFGGALSDIYARARGEYILQLEDDYEVDADKPFVTPALKIMAEFPEIGIVKGKNLNNWWKPHRRIAPIRSTSSGAEFWTWLPSPDGGLNVWATGGVFFRKVSYASVDQPRVGPNIAREDGAEHQGYLFEVDYGRRYNKLWLGAKMVRNYPFVQRNDIPESPGWGEGSPVAQSAQAE
jgi:glycosyltransferase involved in cell wall biosynthesis